MLGDQVLVREARAIAIRHIARYAGPGFRGAFLAGSATVLPGDAPLPATSDVDAVVVVAGEPPVKAGKQLVDGLLVEVSFVSEAALTCAAISWVWAPSFRGGQILADPTGRLAELEAQIAPGYATPSAVAGRVEDVRATIRARLGRLDVEQPWPDLVTAWLFPTSLTAVLAHVAAGGTPTVRLRYLRARDVLPPAHHAVLLRLLGCADVTAAGVGEHLDAVADRFAAAGAAAAADFPHAADLAPAMRPVAIDGSRALVRAGDHREAVFWVVAVAARCQQVLGGDDGWFRQPVGDLTGLRSVDNVRHRREDVLTTIGFFPPRPVSLA